MSRRTNKGERSPEFRGARLQIGSVCIEGFRAIQHLCLRLDADLTVLLGENNAGKSSTLEALGIALGGWGASEDDLHLSSGGERGQQFTIDLTLEPREAEAFDAQTAAVLGNAVQRRGSREFAAIRTTGNPAGDGSGVTLARHFLTGWTGCDGPRTGVQVIENPRVTGRVLDLTTFTLLNAKRDLVADLRNRRTAWGNLLSGLEVPEELAAEMITALTDLGGKVIDSSRILTDLRANLGTIRHALGSSVADVDLAPLPVRIEEVTRAIDVLVSAPGGAALPLRLQGMGSRSLAALLVFQSFVELRLGADLSLPPLAVTALEEPEAHLHPQGQAAVATILAGLPGQKLVSTHSSRVALTARPHQLRFLRRGVGGVDVLALDGSMSLEEAHKLHRLVLRPNADLLFARLVVVGDGATESDALPVFARAYFGQDPEGLGIAFPQTNSLEDQAVTKLIAFLDQLGIPWLALVDGDKAGDQAIQNWEALVGRSLDDADEVLRLPPGWGFERLLVESGCLDEIARGVREVFGAGALGATATKLERPEVSGEVLFKFMCKQKGVYGRAVAEAVVGTIDPDGRPSMPEQVRELFDRAAHVLTAAP